LRWSKSECFDLEAFANGDFGHYHWTNFGQPMNGNEQAHYSRFSKCLIFRDQSSYGHAIRLPHDFSKAMSRLRH
jgi:hypothetical protein